MVWCWVTGWAVSKVSMDDNALSSWSSSPRQHFDLEDEALQSPVFQALFIKWDSITEKRDIMSDYKGATTQSGEDQNKWHISSPIHRMVDQSYWYVCGPMCRIANKAPYLYLTHYVDMQVQATCLWYTVKHEGRKWQCHLSHMMAGHR
jgi:hypothetical protein